MALPVIVLGTLLSATIIPLAVKLLAGLGFGFFVYQGMSALFDASYNFIVEQFDQLPLEVISLLALANFDRAISMIFSAYAVRLILMGVSSTGALTRFGAKGLAQNA